MTFKKQPMTRPFTLLLAALISVSAAAWSIKDYTNSNITGGYNFRLYTPDEAENSQEPVPVIFFLHGRSLSGTNLNNVEQYGPIDAIRKGIDIPAYVVAPITNSGWSPDRVMYTLDWLEDHFRVDSTRVYLIGMSMGGYGTLETAACYPDRIAAAMGMCGGCNKKIDPLAEVPTWIIHGTADNAVPVSKSDRVVERLREINNGERLIYSRIPGANHGSPARLFYHTEVYEWLLDHRLTDPDRPINRKFIIDAKTLSGNIYNTLPGRGRRIR